MLCRPEDRAPRKTRSEEKHGGKTPQKQSTIRAWKLLFSRHSSSGAEKTKTRTRHKTKHPELSSRPFARLGVCFPLLFNSYVFTNEIL